MGHQISAAILKGPFDAECARRFDLPSISLGSSLTLFPLYAGHCDAWSAKLSLDDPEGDWRPLLDARVVHHFLAELASDPLYAIIETDYFGGHGDQAAVVYHARACLMPRTEGRRGPINRALRLLGVRASRGRDEFDTLGLANYRSFDELFVEYWS